MNCPSCAHENPNRAKFCLECGAAFATRCARCDTELPAGAKFCLECGAAVSAGESHASERDPRDYTPKHLAEKILHGKSALEGERKQVTVLFADVKGSMDLAEQVDPEEWHRILNRFFEILTDGVHRFEGTVNQYTGDGIMALFGAPIAHEDHAQRACYAVLHLRDELRRYADELRLQRGLNFSVRMGLNSGDVVVGKIGDDLRMDYTAQGYTVGLAARVEEIAEPGRAYLTEHTASLVEGYFELRDLGQSRLTGVSEAAHIYDLERIGALRTRFDVSRARGFSKFVGRDDEMATLNAALERAIQGNGQVVGVVGEAGVGKSRLCFEFAERCRARGLALYQAHAVAHGKAVPFLPVLELLRSYFAIADRDSDEIARDKIAGRSLRLDEGLADTLPLLFEFLGVPDPRRPAPQMGAEARQRELFDTIRRLAHARSEREPAIFLIEDLHWMDGASEGFVENLVGSLPGTRTLVLLNFRPEFRASWLQTSYYQQLPLVPLGPEALAELLRDLLGPDPSVRQLPDLIQERTGGNPFFVEELVQSLVEAGTLEGAKRTYRLKKPISALAVPGTVQAVLSARIDRLAEREKQVLQTASVIGKKFSESILSEVAELPERDLTEALRALIASEFIFEEALYPEAEYAFKHPLTQEVAYQSQLGERRAGIHRSVAKVLEALESEKLDERAALLAHHREQAGDALEAAEWYRRGARWAATNDATESYRQWRKVRELLDRLAQTPEILVQGAEARSHLILFASRIANFEDDIDSLLREGEEQATRADDPPSLIRILCSYGFLKIFSGQMAESFRVLEAAVRGADESGDPGLRVGSRCGLALAYLNGGRLTEFLTRAEELTSLSREDPEVGTEIVGYSPYLYVLALRGWVYAAMGRYQEASADLDRAITISREHRETLTEMVGQASYVCLLEATGDTRGSLARAREAIAAAQRTGNQIALSFGYERLGKACLLNHEWDDGLNALTQALAIVREGHTGLHYEPMILASLAEVHRGLGDSSMARSTAEQAITKAQQLDAKMHEVFAQIALARALLSFEDTTLGGSVETTLDSTMILVDQIGVEGYRPFIYEARAELARLRGDEPRREQELRQAHRRYVEMDATGHAERLAKELRL